MCKTCILQLVFLQIKNAPQIGEIAFSQPSLFWFFVLTLSFHLATQYVCNFFREFWRPNLLSDTRIRSPACIQQAIYQNDCKLGWLTKDFTKNVVNIINKLTEITPCYHKCPIVVGNARRVKPFCNCTLDIILLYILYDKFILLLLLLLITKGLSTNNFHHA